MVEVFAAGHIRCEKAVALMRKLACSSCKVTVTDMKQQRSVARAQQSGITRVPTSLSTVQSSAAAWEA
jgi:hypothetical protein